MVVISQGLTSNLVNDGIKIKVVEKTDTADAMGQMSKTRRTMHRQSRYIELSIDDGVVDINNWSDKTKRKCNVSRPQVILTLLDTPQIQTVVDTDHQVAYTHVQFDSSTFHDKYQVSQFTYIEMADEYINRATLVGKDPVCDSVIELFDNRAG